MWASIIPGSTYKPAASTTSPAERSRFGPIATILPSTTPMSAENTFSDVTTVPLQNKVSYKFISTPTNEEILPSPEALRGYPLRRRIRLDDGSDHLGSAQTT